MSLLAKRCTVHSMINDSVSEFPINNRFQTLVQHEEDTVSELCRKLFHADRTNDEQSAVELLKSGVEHIDDIRVFLLGNLLCDKFAKPDESDKCGNEEDRIYYSYMGDKEIEAYHSNMKEYFPDMLKDLDGICRLTFKCGDLTFTVDSDDIHDVQQVILKSDNNCTYHVLRSRYAYSKKKTDARCQKILDKLVDYRTIGMPGVGLDNIELGIDQDIDAQKQYAIELYDSGLKRFSVCQDLRLLLLSGMLDSKFKMNAHHDIDVKKYLSTNFPSLGEKTIFDCFPYKFVMNEKYEIESVTFTYDYGCVIYINDDPPHPSEERIVTVCKEIFEAARSDITCANPSYAYALFEEAVIDYPHDVRVLMLCEVLASKYLFEKHFCEGRYLDIALPEVTDVTRFKFYPFIFTVSEGPKVEKVTMKTNYGVSITIENGIDMWDDVLDMMNEDGDDVV